ncbi:MAG TPA: CoA-binding protein, partial [Anaeromyxobacter sp.]
MRPHPLERVFAPRAVAVFGAAGPVGGRVLRNLVAGGFAGVIHAIGDDAGERLPGVRYPATLAEVDGELDLAVIGSTAAEVPELVRACAERHVGGAVLPAGIPGAGARGTGDERALRDVLAGAARAGLRLLGPSSVGIIRPGARLNAAFLNGGAIAGSVGLVSQSGAICASALEWAAAQRIGLSTVVSLGDALDVDFGEVLEYLA